MPVREHLSHHEKAESLPLVTDTAEVTAVEALDHNRNSEVRDRIATLLTRADRTDLFDTDVDGDPEIDWDGVRTLVEESTGVRAEDLSTLLGRYERAYPSLLTVRFRLDVDFTFVPGQYVTVRFRETPRPYSVASSPTDEEVELCIRRVAGGRLTSELFEDLDPGDEITVRGPNGEFVPKELSSHDVAMLATGTGVAPLYSMLAYAFEEGHDTYEGTTRDYWLFLGTGWEDDLAYRDRFRALDEERENFHFVPTLSRERLLTDWDGETAYVQQTFVKYLDSEAVNDDDLGDLAEYRQADPAYDVDARIDPKNLEVYACGVTAMVNGITQTARAVGVPEDCIDGEGFG